MLTVAVKYGNAIYPTHESRVRPFFAKTFVPPKLVDDDSKDLELSNLFNDDEERSSTTDTHIPPERRVSIPQLINTVEVRNIFDSNVKPFKGSVYGMVDLETTITNKLDRMVLTTMA